jgi:hypothetical protein
VRPMDATAVGHHDHLFAGVAKEGHHLMDLLAKPLGLKMGNSLIEDLALPYWPAPRTLSNTPLAMRLQRR